MSRRLPPRKLSIESLERRELLSRNVKTPAVIPFHAAPPRSVEAVAPRTDLDAFAAKLVRSPALAARLGLGELAREMRSHAGYAFRHGWGACLAMELTAHPRYAAAHHLTSLMVAPSAATPVAVKPAAPVATPTPTKPPASTTTGNPGAAPTFAPAVAVGGTLDVTVPHAGLTGTNLTYTITPQPLPANMTFNRGTGELIFAPAPGQAGKYAFTVRISDGVRSVTQAVPITVTNPAVASTQVSGRVVDESGRALASVEVMAGGRMAMTDGKGNFTLTNVPANPGPLTVDGLHTASADRMMLMAPMDQLIGHPLYAKANNVAAAPIVLPRIDTAHAVDFSKADRRKAVDVTNPTLPGVHLTLPAGSAKDGAGAPFAGKLTLTAISADKIRNILPVGLVAGLVEVDAVGLRVDQPVSVTMPNTMGFAPGAKLGLWTMNWVTGAHDLVGQMVVGGDGKSMTSIGGVALASGSMSTTSAAGGVHAAAYESDTSDCIIVAPTGPGPGSPTSPCDCGGQPGANGSSPAAGKGGGPSVLPVIQKFGVMASDAGMVTGEFFLDHPTASYQSQGVQRGLDFQYSSLQADAKPIVQYEISTQAASASDVIEKITAQVTFAGVVQGSPVTYNTPSGLQDGETFRIPLQVDATQLPTGVYPYQMQVTVTYGQEFQYSASQVYEGYVNVVNGAGGADGSGWSVGGVQRIWQPDPYGPALVTAGSQATERFDQHFANGQTAVQDLAFSSAAGTQVFANDGMAMFEPGATSSTYAPVGVAQGDLNGDGKPDLAEVTGSDLTILLNNGSGGFTVGSTYALPSGDAAEAVAVGNFTGHSGGVRDVAVLLSTGSGDAIAVFTGTGYGTFTGPVVSSLGNGAGGTATMAVGDFNGDGKDDLAVTTGDGLLDVTLAGTGGSMSAATSLSLPAYHSAIGVAAVDYSGGGTPGLVVEASDADSYDAAGTYVNLDLYAGNGSGGFSYVSTYATRGHADGATAGLVTGNFAGGSTLEVAVPLAGDYSSGIFMDVVPLSAAGVWGPGVLNPAGPLFSPSTPGNIVAADLNGSGKPSIAWSDGSGQIRVMLADPDSNQLMPVESVATSGTGAQLIAVAPFAGQAAVPGYTAPMGDTSRLVHNSGGTWTRTYADGTIVQFDSSGRETSETDRNGNSTSYSYVASGTAAGALQTVVDPVGLTTTLAYDSGGRLSTVTDPAGRVTHFTVSGGNLTQITDPDGAVWQYGYGSTVTETNPLGHTATAHFDGFGRVTSETLYDGTSTTQIAAAEEKGLLAPGGSGALPLPSSYVGSVTDPSGHTTSLLFNNMDHPAGVTEGNGHTTSSTYDMMGWVASSTDELNRTTTYAHDMKGNVTSITRPGDGGYMGYGAVVETIAYDPSFNVPTSVTDFLGLTTTFTLDAHGNVTRRTDPDGLHEDWTYNSAGQVLTDADRNGNTTTYHYDAYGRLDQVTTPSGVGVGSDVATGGAASASSENSGGGEGSAQAFDQDPGTKWLAFASTDWLQYDLGTGVARTVTGYRMVSANDTASHAGRAPKDWQLKGSNDGSTWTTLDTRTGQADTANFDTRTYSVASPGSYRYYRLDVTANNGDSSYTQLADLQLLAQAPSAASVSSSTITFGYDAAGNVTSTTDELGHTSYATYDAMDRLLTTQDPVQAAAGSTVKTTNVYDAAGNLTSVTDALGHVTSYGYDARNRLTSMVDPVNQGTGLHWTYGYDARGNLTSATDPLGHATTYGYDADNRLTTTTDALSHAWTIGYDDAGEVVSRTDPNGNAATYAYDDKGRLSTVSLPVDYGYGFILPQVVATYAYDADNNVTSLTDANGHATTYAYDRLNRLIRTADALGHATSYAYDPAGNRTSVTDALGHATTDYYDVRDRLIAETAPAGGGTTAYAYDAHSRLTSLTDPVGNVTSWGYDNADRATTETDPRSKVTSYVYDYVGNLTQKTDRDGRVVNYGHDADDRLTTETWVSASPANTITTTYDAAGRTTGVSDANSVYTYGYDNANRLTSVDNYGTTGVPNVVLTSGYNAAGNRTSLTDSLGGTTSYTYDLRNELTRITQSGAGVADKRADFAYDAAGNMTSLTRYSDLSGSTTVLATAYGYDDANRLTTLTHETALSGGTVRASYGYTLDAANRLTSEARTWGSGSSSDTISYTYTNDDQLTGVTHTNTSFANESFGYDANGNRNTTGFSTGTGNRLTSDGTYNYAYDDEGNLTSKTEISTGSQTVYKWDYRNRLTEVDSIVGGVTTVLATYTYDALDRQIKVAEGGATRTSVYDGASPVFDFNGSGTQVARYLKGPTPVGVDAVLARETSGGVVAWYLPDRLGTIYDLVDNTSLVIDHVDYGVFGNVQGESNPPNGDGFKYAEMRYDAVTHLYLDQARWYDPVDGRFVSGDPTEFRGRDADLYRYVFNAPTIYIDPSGQSFWSGAGNFITGVAVGAVGAVAVGGIAVGAVAIGAPVAVVSGGLLLIGGVGMVMVGADAYQNWKDGDWDGLSYNAGSVVGSFCVGVPLGGKMPNSVPRTRPSLGRQWSHRYQKGMGSFGDWLGTGGNHEAYCGVLTGAGAGAASGPDLYKRLLRW